MKADTDDMVCQACSGVAARECRVSCCLLAPQHTATPLLTSVVDQRRVCLTEGFWTKFWHVEPGQGFCGAAGGVS
jgi:hypothetical protein